MNIGWAIAQMQSTIGSGRRCRRRAWPNGIWIAIQKPDPSAERRPEMTVPYVYLGDGAVLAPWIPSQPDLIADDYDFA
jgi:hypothetical protein